MEATPDTPPAMGGLPVPCNYSYVPTTQEYISALGWYGITVLVVGSLGTLGLFIQFFEQVIFTRKTADRPARRHIYWICSIFPLMSLLSIVALVIPRANYICTAVKVTYMSIGISHFVDLTKVMFGGERRMVERAEGKGMNLRQGPLCCCCVCLPSPPVSKVSMRTVSLMAEQLPFTQALYYLLFLILAAENNFNLGDLHPSSLFLWLNTFKLASCLCGVYGLMILANYSEGYLANFNYSRKSFSMRMLVLVTNFLGVIFNVLANYHVFPCLPPYIPPLIYRQTVENSVYLLGMMLLGPYTFWQYHNTEFTNLTKPCCQHKCTAVLGSEKGSQASCKEITSASKASSNISITGNSTKSEASETQEDIEKIP